MVFYYTFQQKTKTFAQALGEMLEQETFELSCDKKPYFLFHALKSCITKKFFPIINMPNSYADEIYVCSPVWGGNLPAPIRYFLENANLKGVTVNILLTAAIPVEKYKKNASDFLNKIPCQQGNIYLFAASNKIPIEKDIIKEQLAEIL